MRIGYIIQKSFNQADGTTIEYLSGSMQILGIANMLEFVLARYPKTPVRMGTVQV